MRIIIAAIGAIFLTACASNDVLVPSETKDPRIVALEQVSISLSNLPPELDLSSYDIEFDVIDVNGTRYVAMDQTEYQKLILLLTESTAHINILRSILTEQVGLIDSALDREKMAEPHKSNS